MKKSIILVLLMTMLFVLSACGKDGAKTNSSRLSSFSSESVTSDTGNSSMGELVNQTEFIQLENWFFVSGIPNNVISFDYADESLSTALRQK